MVGLICKIFAIVVCALVLFGAYVGGFSSTEFLALGCGVGFIGTLL